MVEVSDSLDCAFYRSWLMSQFTRLSELLQNGYDREAILLSEEIQASISSRLLREIDKGADLFEAAALLQSTMDWCKKASYGRFPVNTRVRLG